MSVISDLRKVMRACDPWAGTSNNWGYRLEQIASVEFASVWFRTRGCLHQLENGGCSFCNYGSGPEVSGDEMVSFAADAMASLPESDGRVLFVSPSGSMLDEREVPAEARRRILRLAGQQNCVHVIFETRAETVTEKLLAECRQMLGGKGLSVEIGLEAVDPDVRKFCVNKGNTLDVFKRATDCCRRSGVGVIANIAVGMPFLNTDETIGEAVQTVKWALANGVEQCMLFPIHLRRGTFTEILWKAGLYLPQPIWALVEVLERLPKEELAGTSIAWYEIYSYFSRAGDHIFAHRDDSVIHSPITCPKCWRSAIQEFDRFRAGEGAQSVARLASWDCACKANWRPKPLWPKDMPIETRAAKALERLPKVKLAPATELTVPTD